MIALKSNTLFFLLLSTAAFAQDITIGPIKNNIEMGPLIKWHHFVYRRAH